MPVQVPYLDLSYTALSLSLSKLLEVKCCATWLI